ncbi:hypothetical protein EYF80_061785 [Liparis tanakae]|uniref:Uncharacterized protein n=1 Tax=Liparis tanakae TaxID=230148 RepID=A0A4Z2EGS9_9TELE|nr:hypothetical protein EYF80_061785 [Liparis tanakae]
MSRVIRDFSLSCACSSVCSTTPTRTDICTTSCFSFVTLCLIRTTGAADRQAADRQTGSRQTDRSDSRQTADRSLLKLLTDLKHRRTLKVSRLTGTQPQSAVDSGPLGHAPTGLLVALSGLVENTGFIAVRDPEASSRCPPAAGPGSSVDQGQVDQGQVDQGQVDQGQVDQGQVDQGQIGLGGTGGVKVNEHQQLLLRR